MKKENGQTEEGNDPASEMLKILNNEGVLFKLKVRMPRFKVKLTEEDIGLKKVDSRFIRLGHKRLLQPEVLKEIQSIEGKANAVIEANSYEFMGGAGRFVPNTKLEVVIDTLEKLRIEFSTKVTKFCNNYLQHKESAIADWYSVAEHDLMMAPQDISEFLERISLQFPKLEGLYNKFTMEWFSWEVAMPSAATIKIADLSEKKAVAKAREEARKKAVANIESTVKSFLSEVTITLRNGTEELCNEVLKSMDSSSTKAGIHQKTLDRLCKWVENFKQMDIVGDKSFQQILEHFRNEILTKKASSFQGDKQALEELKKNIKELADAARKLTEEDMQEIQQGFLKSGQRKILKPF
jgi:hypothetical protein